MGTAEDFVGIGRFSAIHAQLRCTTCILYAEICLAILTLALQMFKVRQHLGGPRAYLTA